MDVLKVRVAACDCAHSFAFAKIHASKLTTNGDIDYGEAPPLV
jgi:hypothetical protein